MQDVKTIMDIALERGKVRIELPSYNRAVSFRHRCYRWRKRIKTNTYEAIIIRLKPNSPVLEFVNGEQALTILDDEGERQVLIIQDKKDDALLHEAEALREELEGKL